MFRSTQARHQNAGKRWSSRDGHRFQNTRIARGDGAKCEGMLKLGPCSNQRFFFGIRSCFTTYFFLAMPEKNGKRHCLKNNTDVLIRHMIFSDFSDDVLLPPLDVHEPLLLHYMFFTSSLSYGLPCFSSLREDPPAHLWCICLFLGRQGRTLHLLMITAYVDSVLYWRKLGQRAEQPISWLKV